MKSRVTKWLQDICWVARNEKVFILSVLNKSQMVTEKILYSQQRSYKAWGSSLLTAVTPMEKACSLGVDRGLVSLVPALWKESQWAEVTGTQWVDATLPQDSSSTCRPKNDSVHRNCRDNRTCGKEKKLHYKIYDNQRICLGFILSVDQMVQNALECENNIPTLVWVCVTKETNYQSTRVRM